MRKSIFMVLLGLLLAVPAFAAGTPNKAPVKELIVASDGEYTTITAALASLPDPNTTPVVIKVMPGTYTENITMKSNVHLQGSGYTVTKIANGTAQGITINGINDVEISGFTMESSSGNNDSIHIESSSPIIRNNRFLGGYPIGIRDATSKPLISENIFETNLYIWVKLSASPTISNNRFLLSGRYGIDSSGAATVNINGNVFEGNGSTCFAAISIGSTDFSAAISGNTITNFGCDGIQLPGNPAVETIISGNKIANNTGSGLVINGYSTDDPTMIISDNMILNNGGTGISLYINWDAPLSGNIVRRNAEGINLNNSNLLGIYSINKVANNEITNNTTTDIYIHANTSNNLSFNIFDTISGAVPSSLNVKSDGTPW